MMLKSMGERLDRSARRHLLFEDVVEVRVFLLWIKPKVAGRRGLLVEVGDISADIPRIPGPLSVIRVIEASSQT